MEDEKVIYHSPLSTREARRCAVSGWVYMGERIPWGQLPETALVDWEAAWKWRRRHSGCYFILCAGSLGINYILIDRKKSAYKDVTDYGSW